MMRHPITFLQVEQTKLLCSSCSFSLPARPFTVFFALPWTLFNSFLSSFHWGAQSYRWHSRSVSSASAEQSGKITFLNSAAMLCSMYPRDLPHVGGHVAIDWSGCLDYMLAYIFEFPPCAYPFKPLRFEPILSSNCSNIDSSSYRNPSFYPCVLNSRQPLQPVILLGFPHMQNIAVGQTEVYMEQFKGLK